MALQLHFNPEHSDLRCWLLTPGTCYLLSPAFLLRELLLSCATWLQPGKRPGHRDLSTLQVFLPRQTAKPHVRFPSFLKPLEMVLCSKADEETAI